MLEINHVSHDKHCHTRLTETSIEIPSLGDHHCISPTMMSIKVAAVISTYLLKLK